MSNVTDLYSNTAVGQRIKNCLTLQLFLCISQKTHMGVVLSSQCYQCLSVCVSQDSSHCTPELACGKDDIRGCLGAKFQRPYNLYRKGSLPLYFFASLLTVPWSIYKEPLFTTYTFQQSKALFSTYPSLLWSWGQSTRSAMVHSSEVERGTAGLEPTTL